MVSWRGAALSALALGCLGTALSGLGYAYEGAIFNLNEVVGPAVFWCAAVYFLLSVPFREATSAFGKAIRTPLGTGVFALYMTIHLILYGFLFEGILATIYGVGSFSATSGLFVNTNLFSPLSPASLVFDLAYNPVILLTAPPVFSAALSFYSVSVALVIAVLVVANIGRTREMGTLLRAAKRARAFVLLPTVGIVLGASCCLSVAGLVSLASPATSVLTSSPWIYYVTYFLFPFIAVAVLYLNLRAMDRRLPGS